MQTPNQLVAFSPGSIPASVFMLWINSYKNPCRRPDEENNVVIETVT